MAEMALAPRTDRPRARLATRPALRAGLARRGHHVGGVAERLPGVDAEREPAVGLQQQARPARVVVLRRGMSRLASPLTSATLSPRHCALSM